MDWFLLGLLRSGVSATAAPPPAAGLRTGLVRMWPARARVGLGSSRTYGVALGLLGAPGGKWSRPKFREESAFSADLEPSASLSSRA